MNRFLNAAAWGILGFFALLLALFVALDPQERADGDGSAGARDAGPRARDAPGAADPAPGIPDPDAPAWREAGASGGTPADDDADDADDADDEEKETEPEGRKHGHERKKERKGRGGG